MKRGFTLIELLVVIAIIGMLSSVVLASLNTARLKARDARRASDIRQISIALELFYDEIGRYPAERGCNPDTSAHGINNGTVCDFSSSWHSNMGFTASLSGVNILDFITSLPLDPLNDSTYYYQYEPSCAALNSTGHQGYFIRARFEGDGALHTIESGIQPTTPGCLSKCVDTGGGLCH